MSDVSSGDRVSLYKRSSAWGRWLLAASIAGAALAVGSVHTITLCIVTGCLGAAAVALWWGTAPTKVRRVATLLLVAGLGLTAYTALQCVPMPIGLLEALAPYNADVWSRALLPLREAGPRWVPLSLDPVATRVEVLKGVAYLLAFVAALRVARRREGVAFLSATVVLTGMVLAASALLHPAFKARRLFGIYEAAPEIVDRHVAPFMNPNNLAGYLNIALCLAFAATLSPQPRMPRPIMAAVVLLLAATQLWVASRGGVVTMLLGAVIVVAIVKFVHSPRRGGVAKASILSGAAAAVGAAFMVLGSSVDASDELLVADVSKLKMLARAMRMLGSMPLFGCGRGAFESAYPAFRTDVGYWTYTHPENVLAQWTVEWGMPFGIMGLAALCIALRPNAVIARSTTAAGAWAALVALSVQNLGDLGTEIPGLMLAAVICAAIVVGGTHGREATWRIEGWARSSGRVAVAAGATAAGAIALALTVHGREVVEDRRSMQEAVLERRIAAREMRALAHSAMLRHPAEPYLPFIAGLRALRERDENPIPWMGATLERAPVYGPAHLVLAAAVASRSPSQARLEYRLAMSQAPEVVDGVATEAARLAVGYFDALELVPEGKVGARVLEKLVPSLENRLPASCARLDVELAKRSPTAPGPALREARGAVEDLEMDGQAPWCRANDRAGCLQLALEKADRVEKLTPTQCDGYLLRARARVAAGDAERGLRDLEAAVDRVGDRVGCLQDLIRLAWKAKDTPRAKAALNLIASAGCSGNSECASNLLWVAEVEKSYGNPGKALTLYKRAYGLTPDNDGVLEQMGRIASALGLHAEAAGDYERLARKHPEDVRWKQAYLAERGAIATEAAKP
jgi:tetratricopeptide (TPR) repeat protein